MTRSPSSESSGTHSVHLFIGCLASMWGHRDPGTQSAWLWSSVCETGAFCNTVCLIGLNYSRAVCISQNYPDQWSFWTDLCLVVHVGNYRNQSTFVAQKKMIQVSQACSSAHCTSHTFSALQYIRTRAAKLPQIDNRVRRNQLQSRESIRQTAGTVSFPPAWIRSLESSPRSIDQGWSMTSSAKTRGLTHRLESHNTTKLTAFPV